MKTSRERLAEIIKKASKEIEENTLKKIASKIDWENIGRVEDCDGKTYKMTREGNSVRLVGGGRNRVYPIDIAIPLLDVYDKQGNLMSASEDYD